jgi:membrane protease YdiL (CAAX protease family)
MKKDMMKTGIQEASNSSILFYWHRLPVIVRAIITGSNRYRGWHFTMDFLVRLNIDHLPAIPWSVLPASVFLWFYWKYINGYGWPASTQLIRKKFLRANRLSSDVWGAAIMAGIFGLVSLLLFSGLLNRMIRLPQQDASGVEHVPFISLFLLVIMSSVVAGVSEESGLRGYMQKPIEQRHGPVVAILITGILFGLMHYSHRETTLGLMPFYFFVAVIYGMLTYLTNSILPAMLLHVIGDVFAGLQLFTTGQSEWQRSSVPKPLIWEIGPDNSFWLLLAGFIIISAITVWAYNNLAREVKNNPTTADLQVHAIFIKIRGCNSIHFTFCSFRRKF